MKYTPIMEKLDLPAKEELLRWDPKALILSEEKAFPQRCFGGRRRMNPR